MVRLFLDTNILLDIAFDRKPFYASSSEVFSIIESRKVLGFVNALTCANIFYIIEKQATEVKAKNFLKDVLRVFSIVEVNTDTIEKALEAEGDFEDQIQSISARHIKADYIVTRNGKDFKKSTIAVITPEELLQIL